jgi:PAS domain S-box-containing protein
VHSDSPKRASTVTESLPAEQPLRDSEAHFRSLIEKALDLVAILDENGVYRYASPSHEQASGYRPDELIGKRAFEFLHPDDLVRLAALYAEGIANRQLVATVEYRFRHRDGSWRIVEGVFRNLLDDPAVAGVLINARDVTERRQAEEALRALNQELERRVAERTAELEAANKELEAFSYSVSHDLRAPLRAIDGFSKALMEDYATQLDETGCRYLQRVRDNARHMGQLIDDLLSLSRVTRAELQRRRVDITEMAQAIAAELQKAQPGRDVEFVIAPRLVADADPRLLRIALENLIGNAWKYTSKHPRARIEFGLIAAEQESRPAEEQGGGGASEIPSAPVFFVRDDGAGFDMTFVDRLFGAFQRFHGPKEFEGTGIGLATVQRIIRRHGGRIWAESAVEQGAVFYFTLGPSPRAN